MKHILYAANFAAKKHAQQRRKGIEAIPYINHPLEVALLIADVAGVNDNDIIIAALLHDTIEDTETTAQEIETLFGTAVLNYVLEVSDDKSLSKVKRKQLQVERAASLSKGAKYIKLADKISNVRSVTYTPPQEWPIAQQHEYVEWAYQVYLELKGINMPLETLFEQEYAYGLKLIKLRMSTL